SLITGLAKVMQLNLMPLHWGRWDERLLTHPSTLKRAQAIAAGGGISSERLQEILNSVGEEAEHYALPSAAAEERVFSTTVKARMVTRNSWTILGVMALAPAAMASLARLGHVAIGGWIFFGGLAATLALYLAA